MKLLNVSRSKVYLRAGFTLVEVMVSFVIAGITVVGIIRGYTLAARRTEWSAYSLAAQGMAIKRMEQAVAAPWIPQSGIDCLTNFPMQSEFLALPAKQLALATCTNFTTITILPSTPVTKMVRVDCVWQLPGKTNLFTNTVATIRAPNL